jgi:hypothetical protein
MQLPMSAEAIDNAKKTIGSVLLLAGGLGEIFLLEPTDPYAKAAKLCALVGAVLLGLGFHSARSKSALQLLEQTYGTTKPSEVQKEALAFAQQVASIAPPGSAATDNSITWPKSERASLPERPAPNPPPPPRSKP